MSEQSAFEVAISQVRENPNDDAVWDRLEEIAAEAQTPDEVASLYRELLPSAIDRDFLSDIGQRALNWHEEWLGEDASETIALLDTILARVPEMDWAFARLTMLHTAASRWDALFGVYDRALQSSKNDERSRTLLDEAINVARDFAADAARTRHFMRQLVPLKPDDTGLVEELERLLERDECFADLAELWATRIKLVDTVKASDLRLRIADVALSQLAQPNLALEHLRAAKAEPGDERPVALLERLSNDERADEAVRREALTLLKEQYARMDRTSDVVRALGDAIQYADAVEQVALRREAAERLAQKGMADEALEHYSEILRLAPADEDAREKLEAITRAQGNRMKLVTALAQAANASEESAVRATHFVDAADISARELGQLEPAVEFYDRALAETEIDDEAALVATRRVSEILQTLGRQADRVPHLDRLARLEPEAADRRVVLGQLAALNDELGDVDGAVAAWRRRLEADARDLEALEALEGLFRREERYVELVDVLRARLAGPVSSAQRRNDLVRIARLQHEKLEQPTEAIATWTTVGQEFGEDVEVVDALNTLFEQTEQFTEQAEILRRTALRESEHVGVVYARIGDVLRDRLDDMRGASEAYAEALRIDPSNATSREGLAALLESEDHRPFSAEMLSRAFEATDDWEGLLQLVDARVEGAANDLVRLRLLRQAAQVAESRGNDPSRALELTRRAMVLAPEQREIEGEVLRLAEVTGEWSVAVDAMEQAVSLLGDDAPRTRYLRMVQGGLLEERLGDADRALASYQIAFEFDPSRREAAEAVLRVAARTQAWPAMARTLLVACQTAGELDTGLVDAVETAVGQADGWRAFADELIESMASTELRATLRRDMILRAAGWLLRHLGDESGAIKGYEMATEVDPGYRPSFESLAELQRKEPGRALFGTLIRLFDLSDNNLDPLREATQLALSTLEDADLALNTTDRLYREASRLWKRGTEASGKQRARVCSEWAREQLVGLFGEREEHLRSVALLSDAAVLPISAEESRELRRRAAAIAAEHGDRPRAMALYRAILDETPDDAVVLSALAEVCELEQRLLETLALRQHELSLCGEFDRRLVLRLEVARLVAELERRGGRVDALLANLEEAPGHEESITAIIEALTEAGRFGELADVLTAQAEAVQNDPERGDFAASLHTRVAVLSAEKLRNQRRAIQAHRRAIDLRTTVESLDSLADLHAEQGEFLEAAQWLNRRLNMTDGEVRGDVALRLAAAHAGAENEDLAVACLATASAEQPARADIRERLAELYRGRGETEKLVALLDTAAEHETDADALVRYGQEVLTLCDSAGFWGAGASVLGKAVEREPENRELRMGFARALRNAERFDESQAQLEAVIEGFGRRRNADRAQAHFALGRVLSMKEEVEPALEQLELASKMDMSNPNILRELGAVASKAGKLEQAEKAYRALMLLLRRASSSGDVTELGVSEVQYELYGLASRRGETEQAEGLLKSALEAAQANDVEAQRLVRTLRSVQDFDRALSVLDARLAADAGEARAAVLKLRATILVEDKSDAEEALKSVLEALQLEPWDLSLHEKATSLAATTGQPQRYVEVAAPLLEGKSLDAKVAGKLWRQLGALYGEAGDLEKSARCFKKAVATGEGAVDALFAMADVYQRAGESEREMEVLTEIVESEERVPPNLRADAFYRLGERAMASGDMDSAVARFDSGLAYDPDHVRVARALSAVNLGDHEEGIRLYERTSRASGDRNLLLDFLLKRSQRENAPASRVREAAEVAMELEANEQAETMLARLVGLSTEDLEPSAADRAEAHWAIDRLAELRTAADDIEGAVQWLVKAAEIADPDEAQPHWVRAAETAMQSEAHLSLAGDILERMLERDPTDRTVWQPLLNVYARTGNEDRLNDLSSSMLDQLLEPSDRNDVRMVRAKYLIGLEGREPDAADVLRAMLDDEAEHTEAAQMLADLFERTGYDEDLVDLLQSQFDIARDKQDLENIHSLALRLGELLAKVRREDAIDVYRMALEWLPEARDVSLAYLGLLNDDDDPRERIALLERLLATEEGQHAADMALELAEKWATLEEPAGVQRSLELGYRNCPSDARVRGRLEELYRSNELWEPLANFLTSEANRLDDPEASMPLFREAASIQRTYLGRAREAAEVLGQAFDTRPQDIELFKELVAALRDADAADVALERLNTVLESEHLQDGARAELYSLRADVLFARGEAEDGIADLEAAFALSSEFGNMLVHVLRTVAEHARQQGDVEMERMHTQRAIEVLEATQQLEAATGLLAEWAAHHQDDVEAFRRLRQLYAAAERFDDALNAMERLVSLEEGEAQADVTMAYVDGCAQAGDWARARGLLEHVCQQQPERRDLRSKLLDLYEHVGAHRELASLLLEDAATEEDPEARYEQIRRAGDMFLQGGDTDSAVVALEQARELNPGDHPGTILLVDAYVATERYADAGQLLEDAINSHTRRRSPELAELQSRMARLAEAAGDRHLQMQWLNAAMDSDKSSPVIAAELAELAMMLGDHDLALQALRVVTLSKVDGPMSRARAFLLQAQIAHQKGEARRALLWARKANQEDPELTEAQDFLRTLGDA